MKKSIALVFAASALALTGCSTTPHASKWEYKVVAGRVGGFGGGDTGGFGGGGPEEYRERQQTLLNDLGKDGWVLVGVGEGPTFYFKRRVR